MNKRAPRKAKSKVHNGSFLTKPTYLGDKDIPMSIELIQYDAMHTEIKNVTLQGPVKDQIDKTKVNWFKITGISDATAIDHICREFGLHGFDIRDLLSDQQVVKAVVYDDITYILMSAFYQKENGSIDDMQVAFILGENFIVSFQEESAPVFDEVQENIEENNVLIRKKGSDFLLYILLNAVNAYNVNTIMAIEDGLTDIEDQLIRQQSTVNTLQHLHRCRVNYTHIKRSVISLREEYSNILHSTNKLIKEENVVYFNDFDDRMRATLGNLASFYESLNSLLDIYYNNNNLKMNEIIKRLTIVSTMFIPLTFMVGVWGMNFKIMPETEWSHGYLFAWGVLVLIAIFTFLWMRRQKWF